MFMSLLVVLFMFFCSFLQWTYNIFLCIHLLIWLIHRLCEWLCQWLIFFVPFYFVGALLLLFFNFNHGIFISVYTWEAFYFDYCIFISWTVCIFFLFLLFSLLTHSIVMLSFTLLLFDVGHNRSEASISSHLIQFY